jgi:hypothetical protein
MKNIFYSIWADLIIRVKQNKEYKGSWELNSFFLMTLLMSINIGTTFIWYAHFASRNNWHQLPAIDIDFFPLPMLNSFSSFLINFTIIPILLNYFLIFHHKRYEKMIILYKYRGGKLYLSYGLISIGLMIITVLYIYIYHG